MTAAFAGTALADSANINTTGPDSTNKITVDNSSSVSVDNDNTVKITNVNLQSAQSGDVKANDNTSVGGLGSGNASNSNDTATSVSINNPSVSEVTGGGQGEGGQGGNAGGSGSAGTPAGGQGGSVLGASTVGGMGAGVETLPVTGPSGFVDVSALRNAWHPQSAAPTTNFVKSSKMFTTAMLVIAGLLSLAGAIGSVVYAQRKEARV
jgi:hypothetical protein